MVYGFNLAVTSGHDLQPIISGHDLAWTGSCIPICFTAEAQSVQGYLAHKKQRFPRTPQKDYV